mgnify:CR=1 FL=1|jgi:hypothetical protein
MGEQNIVYHDTLDIMEQMLYLDHSLHVPFRHLDIISAAEGRFVSAARHPELEGLLEPFAEQVRDPEVCSLRMVTVVGNISVTAVIPVKKGGGKARLHHVWYLIGNSSRLEQQSWSYMSAELFDYINFAEFLPEPFCRKIVYFEEWKDSKVLGVVFSEVGKNLWTVGNPMSLPLTQVTSTSAKQIINNIILDIKEV